MSSSYHTRSTSTRRTRRVQVVAPLHSRRSSSAPQRQFIIILTNDPELLQPTGAFQPYVVQQNMTITTRSTQTSATNNGGAVNNNNNHSNNREQILNNLLRVELREAASHYLTRTRRSYPIHYIFDMSDIDTEQL